MRHGPNKNRLDDPDGSDGSDGSDGFVDPDVAEGHSASSVSNNAKDAGVDTLNDVLNLAAEVLADYGEANGGAPGATRIERLARFVALHLGGEPYGPITSGDASPSDTIAIVPAGDSVGFQGEGFVDPDTARGIAVAFLRAAEAVEL